MTLDPALRGARRARHGVHDHLQTHLNTRVGRLIDAGLDVLPVAEWNPAYKPRTQIQAWPALLVVSMGGVNLGRIDWDKGDPDNRWDWRVRVFLWARGEGYESTADRVETLADAVKDELLGRPALGDPADRMSVRPVPMSVQLSDVEPIPNMRASIAGAYVEAIVTMAETATADPPYAEGTDAEPLLIDLVAVPKDPTT